MKKLIGVLAGLIIIIGGVLIYTNYGEKVQVVTANRETISETIEESAYTRASESYALQAPSNGRILEVMVSNGQMIKANDVIIQMQDLTLDAQLAEVNESMAAAEGSISQVEINLDTTNLSLNESRKMLNRYTALWKAQAISQTEYDNAVNEVKKDEQSVNLLNSQIDSGKKQIAALQNEQNSLRQQSGELLIKSAINGQILNLPVKQGQIVEAGSIVAVIGTQNKLEAYTEILSNEAVKVKPGQTASISYADTEGKTISGRVKEVYPQAQEKLSALNVLERRVPVIISLDENGSLHPGYEVKVSINCSTHKNALIIPREALISGPNGETQVRVVKSGRVETRSVATGLKNQLQAEILKGVEPGELVIRDGSLHIDDNKRVRITK